MKKISYNHPEYDRIKREVSNRFDRDFNFIQVAVVDKYHDHDLSDLISHPSFPILVEEWFSSYGNEDDIKNEYCIDSGIEESEIEEDDFYQWVEDNYEGDVLEVFYESEHYPMWSTLFEARDSWLSDWIKSHVDDLYGLGIGVIKSSEAMNALLFIGGAGYDFYEAHWIPLYVNLLEWVKENENEI